jgi:hypothetical protein
VVSVTIGPVTARIAAPLPLIYQMLAAIGQGDPGGGERAHVLSRNGNEFVCDFWTKVSLPGGFDRLVRTRERVMLRPPDRVEYEHLDGPVRGLREEIEVVADPDGYTLMTYAAAYAPRGFLDYLRVKLLGGPVIDHIIREHFDDVRARAEARAVRSRVFPPSGSVSRST